MLYLAFETHKETGHTTYRRYGRKTQKLQTAVDIVKRLERQGKRGFVEQYPGRKIVYLSGV